MGKFKLLLDVVDDIRHLASSLEELVSVIQYDEGEEVGETIEDIKVEEYEKDKEISLEEIREVLANKNQEGFTDEVRLIIKEYNYKKTSRLYGF